MNAERRFSPQQKTTSSEAAPSLGAQTGLEHPAQAPRIFPRSGLMPQKPSLRPSEARPSAVARPSQERQGLSPQEAYSYVAKLVDQGAMTPEMGLQVMGRSQQERDAIIKQLQAQEQQAVVQLKEAGIYEEMKRLGEIQREIPSSITPIEGGSKHYYKKDHHPYQEWREPKELKTMNLKERLLNIASSPKSLFRETYPLVDVIFVDNQDGTQTRYIDRAVQFRHQLKGIQTPEEDVYKETYSKPNKVGHRKLVSRERVGENIIQTGWETVPGPDGEGRPTYGIASKKYYSLIEEQFNLQTEIAEKQKQKFLSQINFGGTDYTPSKQLQKAKQNLEENIENLLWAQKDTPLAKANFALRSFVSNSLFYFLYQDVLPTINPLAQAGSVAGYGFANQGILYGIKDAGRYIKHHPYISAFRLGLPVATILLPGPARIPAALALQIGLQRLPKEIQNHIKRKDFKKFVTEHPEIGKDTMREEFEKRYPEIQRQKVLDQFADQHKEWFEKLKQLNPHLDDNIIKQAIIMKAESHILGNQELQQIFQKLAIDQGIAGIGKYALIPGLFAAFVPIHMLLAQTGLSPLLEHIVTAAAISSVTTPVSMIYLNKTMGKKKAELAITHPEVIPENRRRRSS